MRGAFAHKHFSRSEEIAHAITHGIGLLGSIAGLALLVSRAARTDDARVMVGVTVFGATMVLLYAASTIYHALTSVRAKRVFELLDHGAIYLLIAGTYTPFCLVVLGGTWGWSLFGLAWGLAALGIVYEVVFLRRWRWLSLAFYLTMGWLIVVAARPMMASLPPAGLALVAGGGFAYTAGAVFYAWRGFPYHHAVWHVFVVAGTALHFLCVLNYVIPAS
ncbi:MAG: hemolysin III family protein [Candidatus Krumholzibacteriia bacterium]